MPAPSKQPMQPIEVEITDESELHCLKIVLQARGAEEPIEIFLHTTQAIELQHKLSLAISELHHRDSAALLRVARALEARALEARALEADHGSVQHYNSADGPKIQAAGAPMKKKPNPVYLLKLDEPFSVETAEGDTLSGKPGDYVAHDPISGHVWPVKASYVELHYEPT